MNPFDSYLKKILEKIDVSEEEKHELYNEFLDHLNHLQAEYISKGFSDLESSRLAINAFGDSEKVGKSMEKAMIPFKKWVNGFAWFGLLIYTAVVLKLLLFDDLRLHIREFNKDIDYIRYNLVPFKSISTYLMNFHDYNFDTWFFNTFGNFLVFVPLGLLLPVLFSKARTALKILSCSFAFSLAMEIIQLTMRLGHFDVDDLILNTMGGYIGFILWMLIYKAITKLKEKSRPTVA